MSEKKPRDLEDSLSYLFGARFGIPFACMAGGLVLYIIWWLITNPTVDEIRNQVPYVRIAAFFLALYFFIKIQIKFKALKRYLDALTRKKIDEAVEYGKIYYSIKRKGFLGLDGHAYNLEDEEAISEDIETYSNR